MGCTEKLLVGEGWKENISTSKALLHEVIICKVSVRNITGDMENAVRDKMSRRTMIEFLA